VVLTILKNISQWEGLSHIIWKNKSYVPNHQPDIYIYSDTWYGLLCDERLSNHLLGGPFGKPLLLYLDTVMGIDAT